MLVCLKGLLASLFICLLAFPPVALAFTVGKYIEMNTYRSSVANAGQVLAATEVPLSPGGDMYAYIVSRGDLTSGFSHFSLEYISAGDIRSYLSSLRMELPNRKKLVEFKTRGSQPGIGHALWGGGGARVTFIGKDDEHYPVAQVFSLDVKAGRLKQLTKSLTDVDSYSISDSGNIILYSTYERAGYVDEFQKGFVVDGHAPDRAFISPMDFNVVRHYSLNVNSGATIRLADAARPRKVDAPGTVKFNISPDGAWALKSTQVEAEFPVGWWRYKSTRQFASSLEPDIKQAIISGKKTIDSRSEARALVAITLIDLRTGAERYLVDAPSNQLRPQVAWSPDGESVILARSYVPSSEHEALDMSLPAVDEEAIVEVVLSTGISKIVAPHDDRGTPPNISFDKNRDLVATRIIFGSSAGLRRVDRYRKTDSGWVGLEGGEGQREAGEGVVIRLDVIDESGPPELRAFYPAAGSGVPITSLNPGLLEKSTFSNLKKIKWRDEYNRDWSGTLVYPVGYIEGNRYPLVVQTYAEEGGFLVDPATSGYAARPLSSAGFFVLQLACRSSFSGDFRSEKYEYNRNFGEFNSIMKCMEGGIDSLYDAGLVDKSKIGMIGFSRTGAHVLHALVFSRYRKSIIAATINDSFQTTLSGYIGVYGRAQLEYDNTEDFSFPVPTIGARFYGKGIERWMERSPTFHLDKVSAAVRWVSHGTNAFPLGAWEPFVILKREKRPVEFVRLPGESHEAVTPWGRYASQQGTVDWMRFWILGEEREDLDVEKQYQRWRRLREDVVLP